MKRKLILALAAVTVCAYMAGCSKEDNSNKINNNTVVASESTTNVDATIQLGDSISVNGNGVVIENNIIKITSAGTFEVTGILKDGQIVVEAGDEEDVDIVLNGASITCSNSAPIYIKNAKNATIELVGGSENILTDGQNYVYDDATKEEPNATVFSKCDLKFKGTGSLVVNGNFNNGIVGKDDLEIKNGNIIVNAINDGIKGKDSIQVADGNITINCSGDAMQSDNDTDTTRGYITIESGTFNLTTTGAGDETVSTKGIKAVTNITINGGEFNIDSYDDAIHSNGAVTINGGTINLASEDDGIHADGTLDINDGKINISKSYEGLESEVLNINGGNINLTASDDGINAAGGTDTQDFGMGRGQDPFTGNSNGQINFNGGYVFVNAGGDGLDANGSINMTGGTVIVNGSEDNGNGALDYDGSFNVSGGLLIASGSLGMIQTPSTTSAQNSVSIMLNQQSANTLIHIEDESGNEILTFAPSKNYQSVIVSSPEITTGSTYKVYVGGTSTGIENNGIYTDGEYSDGIETVSFTVSNAVTTAAQDGVSGRQMGGHGGQMGNPGWQMGGPGGQQMPGIDGMTPPTW